MRAKHSEVKAIQDRIHSRKDDVAGLINVLAFSLKCGDYDRGRCVSYRIVSLLDSLSFDARRLKELGVKGGESNAST